MTRLTVSEGIIIASGLITATVAVFIESTPGVLFGWMLVWMGNESYKQRGGK